MAPTKDIKATTEEHIVAQILSTMNMKKLRISTDNKTVILSSLATDFAAICTFIAGLPPALAEAEHGTLTFAEITNPKTIIESCDMDGSIAIAYIDADFDSKEAAFKHAMEQSCRFEFIG